MKATRLSPHLGFPTPDAPLFDALVAGIDPIDHVAFIADRGFGGVVDPFTMMRDPASQRAIGDAAARRGLHMGGFLYAPFDAIGRARWASCDSAVQAMVLGDVRAALDAAQRLGARQIAILSLAEPGEDEPEQLASMIDLLRRAGDLALAAGVELCVEGVNRARLPQMLLHGVARSAALVERTDHPAVRLLFDTGHAAATGEDCAAMLEAHFPLVAAIQIADHPGRVETGGGAIDLNAFFATAERLGFVGQYELEHRWSEPGQSAQRRFLDRLER